MLAADAAGDPRRRGGADRRHPAAQGGHRGRGRRGGVVPAERPGQSHQRGRAAGRRRVRRVTAAGLPRRATTAPPGRATTRSPRCPPDSAPCWTAPSTSTCTASPTWRPACSNRGDDLAVLRLARAYGIRGWVLKSHLWLTTDRAAALQRAARDLGFTVYGSITLNPPMGGVSAAAVELAAAHGARVVFLPTWGAAADVSPRRVHRAAARRAVAVLPRLRRQERRLPAHPVRRPVRRVPRGHRRVPQPGPVPGDRARLAGREPGGRGLLRRRRPAAAGHPPAALHAATPPSCGSSPTSARSSSSATPRSSTPTPTCPSATFTRRCPRSARTGSCSAPTPSPGGPRRNRNACASSSSS